MAAVFPVNSIWLYYFNTVRCLSLFHLENSQINFHSAKGVLSLTAVHTTHLPASNSRGLCYPALPRHTASL